MADLRITEICLLTIITLISYCLGLKILKILKVQTNNFLEEIVFCTGLGLGCLSYLVLGVGLSGFLYTWVFYLIFVVLTIILYQELWYFLRRVFVRITPFKPQYTPFSLICVLFISLTCILAIILLLVPTITFDVLVYHFAVPETYVKNRRIIYLPYNCFSNYTFNTEMLFSLGLLLKGDLLAKSIHFLFGFLSALSIYSLARRYFDSKTAWLSVLVFCSMPLAIFVATAGFNDFAITFYEILAVYAFINWYEERPKTEDQRPKTEDRKQVITPYSLLSTLYSLLPTGWLLVCGLMCGLAIGVKYFGGFCFVILILSILIVAWQQNGILTALKTISIFALCVLIPILPWLIKNFVFTGNPVFPLLYHIFDGKNWSQFHHTRYLYEMTRYSAGHHFLLKPFVFLWNISFKAGGMDSGVKIVVGTIFIVILPFLLSLRKFDFTIKYLLSFCGTFFLFWSYVCAVDRFSLPCFVLLSIVIAYLIERVKFNKLLLAILFICLSWNLINVSKIIYKNSYFMCLKKEKCEEFLLKKSIIRDYCDVVSYINHHLPRQSKILFIGEVRSYYCIRDKLVSTQFDTNIILELIHQSKDIEDLMNKLRELGINYVLYNEIGARWLSQYFDYFHWQSDREEKIYNEFMQKLTLVYRHGPISFNRI